MYATVTNMDSTSNLHKKTLCITQSSEITLQSHNLDFCKLAILIIVLQSPHWHHSSKYATWTTENWNESKQQANRTILEKKEHDIWTSIETQLYHTSHQTGLPSNNWLLNFINPYSKRNTTYVMPIDSTLSVSIVSVYLIFFSTWNIEINSNLGSVPAVGVAPMSTTIITQCTPSYQT